MMLKAAFNAQCRQVLNVTDVFHEDRHWLIKAKFHCTSRFGASSELASVMEFGLERVACSRLGKVGFNRRVKLTIGLG